MIPSELVEALRGRRTILFAGSGVSRSVNLPSWKELIGYMVEQLGYEPSVLMGSKHSAFDFMSVAEFYKLQIGGLSALQTWMQDKWCVSDDLVALSRPHKLIVDLKFPLIYTTNYDHVLEIAHRINSVEYQTIIHAHEIATTKEGVVQIIKFHGDYDEAGSLVLTETDYYSRLAFESPLDIKLRSDVIGRSVLFLGYSLSDINMRLLLYKLQEMWNKSPTRDGRPNSYILMLRPDPVQESVLANWGVTPIIVDVDDPATALESFLEQLRAELQ